MYISRTNSSTIKKNRIFYLSHGKQKTGGYFHEKFLSENLYKALGIEGYTLEVHRQWRYFSSFIQHLTMFFWAFKTGHANINICVSRIAFPIILRNLFNRRKIIVVWHYYDDADNKSRFLHFWYQVLFFLGRFISRKKLAFVVVAPYWENYFKREQKLGKVFLFPNFFDPVVYKAIHSPVKKKQIHLGQVSFKNSDLLIRIAEQLHTSGYSCYFSTNDPEKVHTHPAYLVKYFADFNTYLHEMASSKYTLAFPNIKEGWNRIAHESLLLGTQVIGFNTGGLGDLLIGANAICIEQGELEVIAEKVLQIILSDKQNEINWDFLKDYEVENLGPYLIKIKDWCKG